MFGRKHVPEQKLPAKVIPIHQNHNHKSPPITDDILRQRLLRAQSIFIQECLLYNERAAEGKADFMRFIWAQSNYIRVLTFVLRKLGAS